MWNDNLLPHNYSMGPIGPKSSDPPARVTELIYQVTRAWDVQLLNTHMLPMDVEIIHQIPVSHVPQQEFWAWNYEKSGSFTVRSAYPLYVEMNRRREAWLSGETESSNT